MKSKKIFFLLLIMVLVLLAIFVFTTIASSNAKLIFTKEPRQITKDNLSDPR